MAYEVKKSDVYKTGYKYGNLAGVGPTQAGVYKSGYKYGALAQLLDDVLVQSDTSVQSWLANKWLIGAAAAGLVVWLLSRKDREAGLVANPKVRLTYEKIPDALANFPQLQATEAYIVITPKGTMLGVVWRTRNGMWRNQRFFGSNTDPRLPGRGQSWDIRGPFDSRVEAASDLYHRVAEPENRKEYAPEQVKAVYKAMLKSATDFYAEMYEKTGPVEADYGEFAIYVGRWTDGSWILGDNFDKVMESLLMTPDGRWWLRTYGAGRDPLSFAEAKRLASTYFQDHADELEEW